MDSIMILSPPKQTDFPFFNNKKKEEVEEVSNGNYLDTIHKFKVGFIVRPDNTIQYQELYEHSYAGAADFVRSHSKEHEVVSIAYVEGPLPSGMINGVPEIERRYKRSKSHNQTDRT